MRLWKTLVETLVALAWLSADAWLFTHQQIQLLGTPWAPFLIVTYFGVFFSLWARYKL